MRKILLADDEEIVQSVLRRALEDAQFQLISAYDGNQAVRAAQTERPDLILLDINMPGKNGREVMKELRGDRATQMIPVIFLTGQNEVKDKVAGFELGADDYVTKPFELGELRARVESILRRNKRDLSANPLTHLPGSPAIEEEVERRIRENAPFAFLYVDIDHFKPYNDHYGYAKGDQVIQDTAALLRECLETKKEGEGDFLGHVGGDDFVLVLDASRAEAVAKEAVSGFDRKAPGFYDEEDRRLGFISTNDRSGREARFPFMTLSIALVTNERRKLEHYAKVVDIAFEIKRYLKSRDAKTASVFLKDRRSDNLEKDVP